MDPYRVFFPLGAAAAIVGTMFWISFGFGVTSFYPGGSHPDLMIGGFLFAFSAGFLMTAIPRFTGSALCKPGELASLAALFVAMLWVGFLGDGTWFHALSAASYAFLILYCARRFVTRTYAPPRFFVFVGLGLFSGFFSALSLAFGIAPQVSRLVYTQGTILALILGVGTHLLPAIWGWSDLPINISRLDVKESRFKLFAPVVALAVLLLAGFCSEAETHAVLGRALRATVVLYLAVRHWKILRKPKTRGKLAFWLWISGWTLVFGLWLPVFLPEYWVHALHLAFIGGVGLMTFMVASRVTLAHGGYGVRIEVRSHALTVAAVLMLLAGITRALAFVVPRMYLHHLAYAAVLWIAAVATWLIVFLPKIFSLRQSPR